MRRLVGLLREQGATPEFAPQPSMRAVDVLVGTVREAGLPVEMSVEGEPKVLAPGVDLAAYRVIQEALTNALKYAGPRRRGCRCVGGRTRWRWRSRTTAARSRAARAAVTASSGSASGSRWSGVDRVRPQGRRRLRRSGTPADRRQRVTTRVLIVDDQSLVRAGPDDSRAGAGDRGGGRGCGRADRGARRARDEAGRDPHGRPDAERGRPRGDAPAARGRRKARGS